MFMEGRMHATQVSAGLLQGKCRCYIKVKAKYYASPALTATNDNKRISNKQKVVAVVSDSSSSSDDDNFSCSSCPRKFLTQQALAGHRKLHKGEWESLLDKPDQFQTKTKPDQFQTEASHFSNPVTTPKWPSSRNSSYSLASTTSTLKQPSPLYHLVNSTNVLKASPTNTLRGPSSRCHLLNPADTLKELSARYPFASPTNTLKGSSGFSSSNVFPNAINTHLGPSLIAPQQSFFGKTPLVPSIRAPNRPLVNCAKPHGKSALGVRYESMIHKPCQPRHVGQSDMLLRAGQSPLFGREQMMGCNIRRFGTNSSHADLRSLLTATGSNSTSRSEGGGSSNARNLIFSSFQPGVGKGIVAHDLFPITPAHESHHHDIAHSSKGLVAPPPDHNVDHDVDLDLKL